MNYLTESLIHILVSLFLGFLISTSSLTGNISNDGTIFLFFLLPPIIFDAGLMISQPKFFKHVDIILLLSILGSLISIFTIALLFKIFQYDWITAFKLASLLSSIDPVSSLAVLKDSYPLSEAESLIHGEQNILFILLFGESILNDSVCLSLFRFFTSFEVSEDDSKISSLSFAGVFLYLGKLCFAFTLSVLFGFALSLLLCSIFNRYFTLGKQIQILILFIFLTFALAEYYSLSGIVSLFFFSIGISRYLSNKQHISQVFSAIAKLTELVTFCWLGLSLLNYSVGEWNPLLLLFTIFCCITGRILSVKSVLGLVSFSMPDQSFKGLEKLLILAGVRGAVTFALSITANDASLQTTALGIAALGPLIALCLPLFTDSQGFEFNDLDENALPTMLPSRLFSSISSFEVRFILPIVNQDEEHDVDEDTLYAALDS